jgi:hypothetical protein
MLRGAVTCHHLLTSLYQTSQLPLLLTKNAHRQRAVRLSTASDTSCDRRLVVLIGWLGARQRYFDKCDPM